MKLTNSYRFGFWNNPAGFGDDTFTVTPMPEIEAAVAYVAEARRVGGQWFYPPLLQNRDGVSTTTPRFELPITHVLTTHGRSPDSPYGAFLILALGFSLGMHLQVEGSGHLRKAAVEQATLVNFHASPCECLTIIWAADAFWRKQRDDVRRLMAGAIHWYLACQGYDGQHDRFAWAYTVLDNLHRVAHGMSANYRKEVPNPKGGHGSRPTALAKVFGLALPPEFVDANKLGLNSGNLVQVRNSLVHDALWGGEPIGFRVTQEGHDLTLALLHFCSQAILALLGVECGYLDRPSSGQLQSVDIRRSVPRE